jgi:hypothetical protein
MISTWAFFFQTAYCRKSARIRLRPWFQNWPRSTLPPRAIIMSADPASMEIGCGGVTNGLPFYVVNIRSERGRQSAFMCR